MTQPQFRDFNEVMNKMIDKRSVDGLHTMIPGRIVSFDADSRTCSVEPSVNRRTDTAVQDYPVLEDVRVQFAGGAGYHITHELSEGDTGAIIFSEASIAEWLDQGGVVTPKSQRHHSLSDAVFVPGVYDNKNIPTFNHSGDGITIANSDGTIKLRLDSNGVTIEGDLSVTGDQTETGDKTVAGDFTANGASHSMTASTTIELSSGGVVTITSPAVTIESPAIGLTGNVVSGGTASVAGLLTVLGDMINTAGVLYNGHVHDADGVPTSGPQNPV